MARYRKKAALYEVIGKGHLESGSGSRTERLHPEEKSKDSDSETRVYRSSSGWPRRPRTVQFNSGRLEISMPYQVVVALCLGFVLILLLVFRFGQITVEKQTGRDGANKSVGENIRSAKAVESSTESKTSAKATRTDVAKPKGNNRIVIQTWQSRAQLEPVKKYFDNAGIETEIRTIGNIYYLVTKQKYSNPQRKGTDGYLARQKIIELGAGYKAPAGYGSFGPKPFHDAYGMKFKD